MKKFVALLLAAIMVLSCAAALADGYEIVVVPKDSSNPWFVRMKTGVDEYAAAHPEDTIYQKGTAEIDATLQAQLVDDLVAQGVDAICVVPVDIKSIEPSLKAAREAGILHDITKKLGLEELLILCSKYDILNDALENKSEKLLHSKTGAALSRDLFGISDDVYSAIRWHTTGREDMTLLEKIIYLADYVEPNRDFEGVEPLRKLCYEDLNAAMELGLKMSIEDLEERGSPIHQKTLEAYEYYSKVKG